MGHEVRLSRFMAGNEDYWTLQDCSSSAMACTPLYVFAETSLPLLTFHRTGAVTVEMQGGYLVEDLSDTIYANGKAADLRLVMHGGRASDEQNHRFASAYGLVPGEPTDPCRAFDEYARRNVAVAGG